MVNKKRRPIRKKKNRGGERLAQWRLMKMLHPNIEICNVSNEDIASGITTSNSVKEMIEDSADQWDDSKSLIQTDGTDELGNSNEFFISGRRLVDLNYFIAQIKCISNHAPQLGCSIVNMKLQNEIKRDFNYGLVFACDMCGMVKTIWTEPEEIAMMDMSGTTRVGAISSCSDFTRTEKQMGSKNALYSSFKTYQKHSQAVSKGWEKSALQEMKKSAEEECRMVRKRGNTLDAADGSWAKRSSHTNCNPLDRIGNASSPGVSKGTWSLGGPPNLQVDLPFEEYEMKQEEEEEIIDFQTPEAFSPSGSVESVFHVQGVPSPSAGIDVPVCSNQTDSTRPPCVPPPHLDVQNKTKQDGSFRTAALPDPICAVFVKEEPEQEESSNSAFYEEDQSAFSVQQPKEIFKNKGTNQTMTRSQRKAQLALTTQGNERRSTTTEPPEDITKEQSDKYLLALSTQGRTFETTITEPSEDIFSQGKSNSSTSINDTDSDSHYLPSNAETSSTSDEDDINILEDPDVVDFTSKTTDEDNLNPFNEPGDNSDPNSNVFNLSKTKEVKNTIKSNQDRKGKKNKNFCFYCKTDVLDFARHLFRNHSAEIDVQRAMATPKGYKRNTIITKIRKKGNYINASSCGNYKPVRKLTCNSPSKIALCPFCKGFYCRRRLWRHKKNCKQRNNIPSVSIIPNDFFSTDKSIHKDLMVRVFPRMHPSMSNMVAKKDPLICAFGTHFLKTHKEVHHAPICSRKMRELAMVLIEMQKLDPNIPNLLQALKPENFDKLVQATKKAAGYDQENGTFRDAAYPKNVSTSFKTCCELAMIDALKKKHTKYGERFKLIKDELETTKRLLTSQWKTEIIPPSSRPFARQEKNVSIVPLASDLKIMRDFLVTQGNSSAEALQLDPTDEKAIQIDVHEGHTEQQPVVKAIPTRKKRIIHKWTEEQRKVVKDNFKFEIEKGLPLKKHQVMALYEKYPLLGLPEEWMKIKVFVQNCSNKKC